MKTRISALMDGELEAHEVRETLDALRRGEQLRARWRDAHLIGEALRDIGYNGTVVMEPFIKMGGTVGSDIKVWRDLSEGANEAEMDKQAQDALVFQRYMLG